MSSSRQIIVSGAFDDIRSRQIRFLEEASKLGELTVLLWPDAMLEQRSDGPPKFPLAERFYLLNAARYVSRVIVASELADADALPLLRDIQPALWVDEAASRNPARSDYCRRHGLEYRLLTDGELSGFPAPAPAASTSGRKKVVVTGCYDWFHSGHVRFFEEVSSYGDLYVVVGHDANIRLLKGAGHPLLPEAERRYMVGSIKYVEQALLSSGAGWLDADPEIRRLKPDIYAVNEDGDRGGKREYCEKLGIQYMVLKRTPAAGLPKRSSTDFRGF